MFIRNITRLSVSDGTRKEIQEKIVNGSGIQHRAGWRMYYAVLSERRSTFALSQFGALLLIRLSCSSEAEVAVWDERGPA